MESSEQITTCAKCGLHIAPGREIQVTPETVAHARTSYVEHRDCDPKAVVADFHAYREELRGSDTSRIAAIAQEIRPTLDMLRMQALGETLSRKQSKSDSD